MSSGACSTILATTVAALMTTSAASHTMHELCELKTGLEASQSDSKTLKTGRDCKAMGVTMSE